MSLLPRGSHIWSTMLLNCLLYAATVTGTGSLIFFESQHCDVHAVIYQQWGGGLDGVGYTLATFLKRVQILTYHRDEEYDTDIYCNGFSDLVARYIRKLKRDQPGHTFYIFPNISDVEEEYIYRVQATAAGAIQVQVNNSSKMSIDQFMKLCRDCKNTGKVV